MKLNSSMRILIATAVAALAAASAKASQVPQYNNGDLLLGFYDYSGTVTNDYLVDLGPVSALTSSTTFNLGLATDLSNGSKLFGSSWYTSGNIYYGLAASYPLTGQVFATNPNAGTPWGESTVQGTPASAVESIGQQYSLSTQSNGETYSAGLIQSDNATNSWESVASNGLNSYFSSGGDGAISDVVSNSLEFDEINVGANGAPSTKIGTFSLSSAGNLTYTAAVPEPSTYAAFALGAAILCFARRRRSLSL